MLAELNCFRLSVGLSVVTLTQSFLSEKQGKLLKYKMQSVVVVCILLGLFCLKQCGIILFMFLILEGDGCLFPPCWSIVHSFRRILTFLWKMKKKVKCP